MIAFAYCFMALCWISVGLLFLSVRIARRAIKLNREFLDNWRPKDDIENAMANGYDIEYVQWLEKRNGIGNVKGS